MWISFSSEVGGALFRKQQGTLWMLGLVRNYKAVPLHELPPCDVVMYAAIKVRLLVLLLCTTVPRDDEVAIYFIPSSMPTSANPSDAAIGTKLHVVCFARKPMQHRNGHLASVKLELTWESAEGAISKLELISTGSI